MLKVCVKLEFSFFFGPMYSVFETKDGGWILAFDVLFWMTGGIVLFHTGISLERGNR